MITKFLNIQALRGVAVLLVVCFHLMLIEHKYSGNFSILPNFLNIGTAGVDLFFVISGFVMVVVTRNCFQQVSAIQHFIYHRITRIYPLYWFYSSLILIVYLLHPELINASQGHQVHLLQSFLLLPQDKLPLLMVGWTLIHEMYFYLLITLLMFAPERYFLYLLSSWGLLIALANFLLPSLHSAANNSALLLITHPLTFEFIAGCLIARIIYAGKISYGLILLIAGIIFGLTSYSFYFSHASNLIPDNWSRVFIFGISAALIVYAATALEIQNKIFPLWLRSIGNASYSIYLSHIIVLTFLGRILEKLLQHNYSLHILTLGMMLITTIIFGLLSYHLVERPLLKLFRNWKISRAAENSVT